MNHEKVLKKDSRLISEVICHRRRGNGLVEFLLCVPLFIGFLSSLLFIGSAALFKPRLQSAVRLGTLLQAMETVPESAIKEELELIEKSFPRPFQGVEWTLGRFLDTPSSRFYNMVMTRGRISVPLFLEESTLTFDEKVVAAGDEKS